MNYRKLGKTGISVSEIGFGTLAIGGDSASGRYSGFASYGPADDLVSRAAIQAALEAGITLFDTADVFGHGHAEALLGEILSDWPDRDKITLVTKGGMNFYRPGEIPEQDFTPYGLANSIQHSRARLKCEKLDVFLLMNPPFEIIEKDYVRQTLESLQTAGHIRHFGVSSGSTEDAVAILQSDFPLDVIEFPFSLFDQSALNSALDLAHSRGIGVIAREPLANGFLTGKYTDDTQFASTDMRSELPPEYIAAMCEVASQLLLALTKTNRTLAQAALRFVLDQSAVSSVAVGMRTVQQVVENVQASDLPSLTDNERLAIHHVFFPEDANSK